MAGSYRLDWVRGTTSLDLASADGGGGSYWFEVLADAFDPGSVQSVKETTEALFLDGANTIATRDGNVTKAFNIRVCGTDSAALADGEAALDLMRGRRGSEIRWNPYDGYGATSVRKVMVADLDYLYDDLDEMLRKQRVFRVSMECLPHVYSADDVTYTVGTGAASIADVTTMTDWTVISGSADASTGFVKVTGAGNAVLEFTPSADLDEYLYLDLATATLGAVSVDGSDIPFTKWRQEAGLLYTIPLGEARGTRSKIRLTVALSGELREVSTRSYPDSGGIVVFDAVGTRRSPAVVSLYRSA